MAAFLRDEAEEAEGQSGGADSTRLPTLPRISRVPLAMHELTVRTQWIWLAKLRCRWAGSRVHAPGQAEHFLEIMYILRICKGWLIHVSLNGSELQLQLHLYSPGPLLPLSPEDSASCSYSGLMGK